MYDNCVVVCSNSSISNRSISNSSNLTSDNLNNGNSNISNSIINNNSSIPNNAARLHVIHIDQNYLIR